MMVGTQRNDIKYQCIDTVDYFTVNLELLLLLWNSYIHLCPAEVHRNGKSCATLLKGFSTYTLFRELSFAHFLENILTQLVLKTH